MLGDTQPDSAIPTQGLRAFINQSDLNNYTKRIVNFGNFYKIVCGGTKLAEAKEGQLVLYKDIVDGTWYVGNSKSVIDKKLTDLLYRRKYYMLDRVLNGKWYIVSHKLEILKEYIR